MEGEERDAERKGDIGLRQRQSERRQQRCEIAGDEIGVFEHREDEKISRHRDGERNSAGRALSFVNDQRGKEVEDDREQKDQDEARFSPGVEKEGEQQRDDILALDRRGEEIKSQKDRQEIEQERYRGKDHFRSACVELPVRWERACRGRHSDLPVRAWEGRTPAGWAGRIVAARSSATPESRGQSLRRFVTDVQTPAPPPLEAGAGSTNRSRE